MLSSIDKNTRRYPKSNTRGVKKCSVRYRGYVSYGGYGEYREIREFNE